MHIFISTSYSTKVNYDTGEVFEEYKLWLENILTTIESTGHTVFCALRADNYKINDPDPAEAFSLDINELRKSDVVLALLNDSVSAGVQTEIGYAVALEKEVVIAHEPDHSLQYFNMAMMRAGVAKSLVLPLTKEKLEAVLAETISD